MIDYASIKPVMSLSTFILLMMAVLLIGRAFVELSNYVEDKQKARETLADVQQAGQAHLSASQKAIQRYYNTYRKGA